MAIKFAPKSDPIPTPAAKKPQQPVENPAQELPMDAARAEKPVRSKAKKPVKPPVKKDDELF